MRRSHHALVAPTLVECSQCKNLITPHQACENCGFYRGRKVIKEAINDKIK
ncbi:50S ribosomal protein L32 [Metamycoplasma hominis]|uniref:50S ribosomal protein L32 n=1 Tax=Metamycoplasma hominis TaxID=2098 RepID=UPI003A5C79F9